MPTRPGKRAEKKKAENRKDREVKVKLLYDRLRFHYGLNLTSSELEVLYKLTRSTKSLRQIYTEIVGEDDELENELQDTQTAAYATPGKPSSIVSAQSGGLEPVEKDAILAAHAHRQAEAHDAQLV